MIKINLLPTKRKPPKKVTELQKQLILGTLLLIFSGSIMAAWWMKLDSTITRLKSEKKETDDKIAAQKKILDSVKDIKDVRQKVLAKIEVIDKLKANQMGPVRLLDEVSKALPKGVGLNSLTDKKGQVDIDGTAFTNNDVVFFIDRLKASPYFSEVFLLETQQAKIEGVDVYKYKLRLVFKGV